MSYCYACGKEFPEDFKVYRNTECPSCGRDVKVCLNCRFYNPGAQYDCSENISEAVRDKEKSNFCEFFSLSSRAGSGIKETKAQKAREALDNLFSNE